MTSRAVRPMPPKGLEEVQDLNAELQAWPLQDLELAPAERQTTISRAQQLLERARELLQSLEGRSTPTSTTWGGPKPEDVAFFALREISGLHAALERLDDGASARQVMETCERQRGLLMKACSALHRALCRHAGYDCTDEVWASEVAKALRVRARFASFRAHLDRGLRISGEEMTRRMRLAGTVLAMLVGSKEYQDLRIGDRALILSIQREILAWLASPSPDELHCATRIWGDLMGFVEITRGINRRAEFEEHDEQAMSRLSEALAGCGPSEPLSSELQSIACSLWGRYPTLDRLIEGEPQPSGVWYECVCELRPSGASPGAGGVAACQPVAAIACFS